MADPRAVKRFLHKIGEPCVDWFDFSTAERCNDLPAVREVFSDREDVVLWKFLTTDGVEGYVYIGLEVQQGLIHVDCRLEEPEGATLWRLFMPVINRRLKGCGIEPPKAHKMTEYMVELRKRLPKSQPVPKEHRVARPATPKG